MTCRIINEQQVYDFRQHLIEEEKSINTITKYMYDIENFRRFSGEIEVCKEHVIAYKKQLTQTYKAVSANSMLAALNSFFTFLGWHNCKVRLIKLQKKIFCSEEKELTRKDYEKLIQAAKRKNNNRLNLVIQTITNTGIRVSELPYITVRAVMEGRVEVSCKGKVRMIFIHKTIRQLLLVYIKEQNIKSGSVFVTRTGKPLNRSNIWRDMKALCKEAGVSPEKVFPHNLRHLFARSYHEMDENIVKLANILGHTNLNTTRLYTISSGRGYAKQLSALRLVFD